MRKFFTKSQRNELVTRLKEALERCPELSFAFLHGSFVDYDERVGVGDLDVAVCFATFDDPAGVALELGAKLSVELALDVDCVSLDVAPAHFRYRVFRDGVELVCNDEELRDEMWERTIITALDLMPMREQAIRDLVI